MVDADQPADADTDADSDATSLMDDTPGTPVESGRPEIGRRRLLALSSVAAGALAGCGGGDDGGDGTTAGSTTGDPTSTTPTPTETTPTTSQPTTPPTTTVSYDPALVAAPSSELQPTDGFASADWFFVGPEVVKVTNLNAEGEGSLRAAINGSEPRIVVFEVGGVIDLRDSTGLGADAGRVFIAGQTAPSPGITIIRGNVGFEGDHTVVQHVRVRVGDGVDDQPDGMTSRSEAENVIFDHCSVSWAVDENMSTGGSPESNNVTFLNNLIAECLRDSIHPKGPHSMGSLILNNSRKITVMGNVYASNENRNPRLKGGTTSAVVNNLVYNFGRGGMLGGDAERRTETSLVGNHYVAGPATDPENPVVFPRDDADTPGVYAEDNRTEPSSMPVLGDRVDTLDSHPVWPGDQLSPIPSEEVFEHNLATAGARPAEHTHHDERILQSVAEDTGALVDSQEEVGGYPELETTERPLDPPAHGEGLTEWLFQHTLAVEVPGASPP